MKGNRSKETKARTRIVPREVVCVGKGMRVRVRHKIVT